VATAGGKKGRSLLFGECGRISRRFSQGTATTTAVVVVTIVREKLIEWAPVDGGDGLVSTTWAVLFHSQGPDLATPRRSGSISLNSLCA
jgi:hypothetical protein